jgi:glycosyltransferase involved in cell wall biosynthesis
MDNIKVSIVVPVYNSEKYLYQCLDSLLAQTLHGIEIICVNDGSNDSSACILGKYKNRANNIKIVYRNHTGQGMARNTGVSMACGEYIGFVDADDYIDKTMYQQMYEVCVDHNVDCAVCKAMTVNSDGTDIQQLKTWGTLPANIYTNEDIKRLDWFNTGCSPVLWDKLFKSEIVKRNPSTNLQRGQDFVALIDYMKEMNAVEIIDKHLYYYRHHNQSVMSRPENIQTLSIDLQTEAIATKKIISNYKGFPIADFYMNELTESWNRRLLQKKLSNEEKRILCSIFEAQFIHIKDRYETQYNMLYNLLTCLAQCPSGRLFTTLSGLHERMK